MADAVTFDIRIRATGASKAGGGDPGDLGDPREAIERDRRAAEGATPSPEGPRRSARSPEPTRPARRLLTEEEGVVRDIRAEATAAAEATSTPEERLARDAWRLRALVERVIDERKDREDKESQRILADMRDRLAWLDENFAEDFEHFRKGQDGGGDVAGTLGQAATIGAQGAAFLRNPVQGVSAILSRILAGAPGGPVGLAAAAVTALATAVVPEVIRTLAQKGWPLNRDWRRAVTEEANAAYDIRQQEERLAGRDIYIYAQPTPFGQVDGTDVVNSLYRRDELRASMRTQAELAVGGFY